ncbi:hypothetical protein T4A_3436, partial [Trichinella pseudospiralis]
MLGHQARGKPCSIISSTLKFRFRTFIMLAQPHKPKSTSIITNIWFLRLIFDEQDKTESVTRQMDDGYTQGRGSVVVSAAYENWNRQVATLMGCKISTDHFLKGIAYHILAL